MVSNTHLYLCVVITHHIAHGSPFFGDGPAQGLTKSSPNKSMHKRYEMRVDEDRAILARALSPFAIVFTGFCLLAAPTVFAQDEDDDLAGLEDDSAVEEIIVTG
jgi:hypothetical protein